MTDAPSVKILVIPDFQGQLRKLAKRYRNIRADLQPLFDDLERENCPGDQIPGATQTIFAIAKRSLGSSRTQGSGPQVICLAPKTMVSGEEASQFPGIAS